MVGADAPARILLSSPLFRGKVMSHGRLGSAHEDEWCERSIRAPDCGASPRMGAPAAVVPPSPPVADQGAEDWDVKRRHQIPLRDSSGLSPDSIRSHRVIAARLAPRRPLARFFSGKFPRRAAHSPALPLARPRRRDTNPPVNSPTGKRPSKSLLPQFCDRLHDYPQIRPAGEQACSTTTK